MQICVGEVVDELSLLLGGPHGAEKRRRQVLGQVTDGAAFPGTPERSRRVEKKRLNSQHEADLRRNLN